MSFMDRRYKKEDPIVNYCINSFVLYFLFQFLHLHILNNLEIMTSKTQVKNGLRVGQTDEYFV